MFNILNFKVILFGFIFTFFSSFGQSFFLGLFNSSIRDALSITHGQFGSIYASATIAREIYAHSLKSEFGFLDAPVSGGQAGAENGALTVMIGGDQPNFEKAKDIIDCYSKKMKFLGGAGNGQLAKMVN